MGSLISLLIAIKFETLVVKFETLFELCEKRISRLFSYEGD